ncbi:MAG: septum formation initiator family protein [Treponema sp.]|jgi:cell division protein FtsB|nr:septum formation initiator family protein [Treponema sp.]
MKSVKYLAPVWISIVVYSALSLFYGAAGFSAYAQLLREKDRQKQNMEALQELNRKLKGDADALIYDSDTIAAYARELGYGKSEERFIRIMGFSTKGKQNMYPGSAVIAAKPEFMPEGDIRFISFMCGFSALGCILAFDLMRISMPHRKFQI